MLPGRTRQVASAGCGGGERWGVCAFFYKDCAPLERGIDVGVLGISGRGGVVEGGEKD